jgi:pimeloyl-ACP methyl ester carboxylesterase
VVDSASRERKAMVDTAVDRHVVDLRVAVPAQPVGEPGWEIAVTVYLPIGEVADAGVPVLVLLPGGGYGRLYFDLPDRGYSQADHHVRRGTVVVALDHLGSGESSIPPMEVSTLPVVAAANHAAVNGVLERLRDGTLLAGRLPAIEIGAVVGAGQSMGGHIAAAMQARHHTFDAIALMGASVLTTTIPRRNAAVPGIIPSQPATTDREPDVLEDIDWPWAFHWVEDPSPLATADIEAGIPLKIEAVAWASTTVPGLAVTLLEPGAVAAEVASIDVPVLLAAGERDVTCPLLAEAAAFAAATDVAMFRVRRMAHMHNFAPARHLLWGRLDDFISQAVRVARTTPTPAYQPTGDRPE